MRTFSTYPSALQAAIVALIFILCCALTSRSSGAETDTLTNPIDPKAYFEDAGKLRLHCKSYIKSHRPSYTHRARKVTVECVNLADNSSVIYVSRSGKLSIEFKLDARYLVYVSKEGYETKMLAFSTKGADPTHVYQFDFDLLLEKSGKAKYDEYTPSIYIVYNKSHRLFLYKRFLFRASTDR